MHSPSRLYTPSRRSFLRSGLSAAAIAAVLPLQAARLAAQDATAAAPGTEEPFDFDSLIARAKAMAASDYEPVAPLGAPFSELDYDAYRNIQFKEDSALWAGPGAPAVLHAYHPGWLFDTTVQLFEVAEGRARPLVFSTDDFNYYGNAAEALPAGTDLPGVAGFRLNAPLNAPDRYDEVVSFLGASYFRALGAGNRYGLSARGLAVNTATSEAEEFPMFTAFWLERPAPGDTQIRFYALLDSQSVVGAYSFVLSAGETTTMDVTTDLFFRNDVAQLGIAPLTSMYLFGPNDRGSFDDYRERVHDSEALVINTGDKVLYRVLNNPPQLANSYFGTPSPQSFGLVQRHRGFDDYLDAGAHYEMRPSLMVQPLDDWGTGNVRLIEIPSELEANDNIVAFWIPAGDFKGGDEKRMSYRLLWGAEPAGASSDLAQVSRTLAGNGGVGGLKPRTDRRKFVIDFEGPALGEPIEDSPVSAHVDVVGGTLTQEVLQKVDGHDHMWRLVLEVAADNNATVELRAFLGAEDKPLTETWVYQWLKE